MNSLSRSRWGGGGLAGLFCGGFRANSSANVLLHIAGDVLQRGGYFHLHALQLLLAPVDGGQQSVLHMPQH